MSVSISTACATANYCFYAAANHIRRGEADIMLVGGTKVAILPIGLGGFVACRALSQRNDEPEKASRPWDKERDGFVMGEGAGVLADVSHAFEILKKGGLEDENMVMFMYDDIANQPDNPRPGIIINSPQVQDVYARVPKDYTHDEVNVTNLFAVILGDKESVKGGSEKVMNSGPDDYVFINYTDHGGLGLLDIEG